MIYLALSLKISNIMRVALTIKTPAMTTKMIKMVKMILEAGSNILSLKTIIRKIIDAQKISAVINFQN